MRINQENKSVDMEARDINYILPAYVRSYLFYNKNEMPEKIIFPMFPSVKVGDKDIPIEYVPPLDAIAVEIAENGKSVAEVTPEREAVLDEKDERIKELKAEVAVKPEDILEPIEPGSDEAISKGAPAPEDLIRQQQETIEQLEDETADLQLEVDTSPPAESPARAAFQVDPNPAHQPPPDRKPIQPPGGDIGPGMGLSDMHARDRRDQIRTARDLAEEPEIVEEAEKPYEKDITRDEQGRPVVEEKQEEG